MVLLLVKKIFFPDVLKATADIDIENKALEGLLLSVVFNLCDEKSSRYVLLKESLR